MSHFTDTIAMVFGYYHTPLKVLAGHEYNALINCDNGSLLFYVTNNLVPPFSIQFRKLAPVIRKVRYTKLLLSQNNLKASLNFMVLLLKKKERRSRAFSPGLHWLSTQPKWRFNQLFRSGGSGSGYSGR